MMSGTVAQRIAGVRRRLANGPVSRDAVTATASRALRAGQSVAGVVVPAVVLVVLALCATAGWFSRNVVPDGEYLLFFEALELHTKLMVGIFAAFLVLFGGLLAAVVTWSGRALDARPVAVAGGRLMARVDTAVDWVLARWWRVTLLLILAWSPLIIGQYPGTSNADLVMQAREVLASRSELDYPPFDVYPIGHYLVPDGDVLLSEHHNALLTLFYGSVLGVSLDRFGNFEAGLIALTMSQLAFTLIAFGRASELLARRVDHPGVKKIFLIVLLLSGFPTVLWAMAISKNPLFGAALVWLIALAVDHVLGADRPRWLRSVEWAVPALLALNSAKFALPIIVVLLILALLGRSGWSGWKVVLTGVAVPILVTQMVVGIGVAQGKIIPGDPLAGKGLQIQSLALTLRERPEALSAEDRRALDEIFDVDLMVEEFTPRTMGPIRGAGFIDGAYRWRSVTAQEAAAFNGIWKRAALEEPAMMGNAVILTTYKYFDPFTQAKDNRPTIRNDDGVSVLEVTDGVHLNDDFTNLERREDLNAVADDVASEPWLLLARNGSTRTVLVILLATAAIVLRRPAAWIWALPMALHCGVFLLAPLDSSGRYALGVTYFLPFAVLAVASARRALPSPVPPTPGETAEDGQSIEDGQSAAPDGASSAPDRG